jgi:hypothetical protein
VRAADRPLPAVALDDAVNLAGWPVRPVLAVDTGTGWIDATCDLYGFTLKVGPADEHFDWPPAELHIQLDNRTGAWSRITATGTPSQYGPGTRLALWAHYPTGTDEWICFAQATAWNQAGEVVEVTAFDMFATLAQPIGPFTAGAAGDQPGARSSAIIAATGRAIPTRFDGGVVALTAQQTKSAPLEDLQAVAASDGGVLIADADGTVITFGRDWRRGRADQTAVLTVSDNVCTGVDAVIWEPTFTIDDNGYAGYVVLSTVGNLKATAGVPTAPFVYAESDLQFANAGEGNSVAAALLQHLARPLATLDHFDVHVNDPHQPRLAELVALRPLDRIKWVHTELAAGGGTFTLTGTALVVGVEHAMSPSSGWTLTVDTLAGDDLATLLYWDQAAPYTWDDPRASWS